MTLKAKPVLKDKFWIIENNEERIGTMSWNDDRYMFSSQVETCFFDNKRQMKQRFGADIIWNDVTPNKEVDTESAYMVHGFPTSVRPHNTVFDIKRKLPLFTKSDSSKSSYCAGYYIIRFEKGWVKSFCPKLITIERYESKGPFKSEMEMRLELRRAKN
jgi:hypothetical protein